MKSRYDMDGLDESTLAGKAAPTAGLMDRLSHLTFEELTDEKKRLEKDRRGPGLHPDEFYRLYAVKALIEKHEAERVIRGSRARYRSILEDGEDQVA